MNISLIKISFFLVFIFWVSSSHLFCIIIESVIWEPNNKLGQFTELPSAFDNIIAKKDDQSTINVSGGGSELYDLFPAPDDASYPVNLNSFRDSDGWIIVEITDSDTYNGNIHIDYHKKVIIRAKVGETPVIDCSRNLNTSMGNYKDHMFADRGIYLGTQLNLPITGSGVGASDACNNVGIIGIKFMNTPSSHTWFRGSITNCPREYSARVLNSGVNTILIEDCYFYNEGTYNDAQNHNYQGGGMGITFQNVDNIAIIRTKLENMAEYGYGTMSDYAAIYLGPTGQTPPVTNNSSNIYLKNVYIKSRGHDVTYNQARGILAAADNVNMEYVLVENTGHRSSNGAFKMDNETNNGTWSLKNCVATKCNRGFYQDASTGTSTVNHCTFNECYDRTIRINSGTSTIKNSIIVNSPSGKGIYFRGTTLNNNNNDVWNNSTNYDGCSAGTGSISVDPSFNNANNLDFGVNANQVIGGGDDGLDMGILFTPTHVWVYNDWAGNSNGDIVDVHGNNKIFGYNAFDNMANGVENVDRSGTVTVVVDNDVSCGANEDNDYSWTVNGDNFENYNIEIENGGGGSNSCPNNKAVLTVTNNAGSNPVLIGTLSAGNNTTIDISGAMTIIGNLVLATGVAVLVGGEAFKVEGDTEIGEGSYIETNNSGAYVLTLQPGTPTTFPLMFEGQYSPLVITSGIQATFSVSGRLSGKDGYPSVSNCLWLIEGPNFTSSSIKFQYPKSVVPSDFDPNNLACYKLVTGEFWMEYDVLTTTEIQIAGVDYYETVVTNIQGFSTWGIFDVNAFPVPFPWWAIALFGVTLAATGGYFIFRKIA